MEVEPPPLALVGVGAAELQRIGCSAARGEALRASGVAAQLDSSYESNKAAVPAYFLPSCSAVRGGGGGCLFRNTRLICAAARQDVSHFVELNKAAVTKDVPGVWFDSSGRSWSESHRSAAPRCCQRV